MIEHIVKQVINASGFNFKYDTFIVERAKELYYPNRLPKVGDYYTFNLFGKHIQCRVKEIIDNEIYIE
ncbi:hypothetical protein CMT22_17845 [Elizabethkingia anophelis]|nr:hypothetical protein [Elizabethkingia anophelis]